MASSIKLKHLHAPIFTGNPFICKIGNELVHSDSLHSLNHVYAIANTTNIPLNGNNLFVEIGSGAGLTARQLLKTYINSKIILVDIPEILIISSYVLSKDFPDKKIAFFDEIKSIEKAVQDFDILLIPHWFADNIPNSVVDLFVNTTSLPDMPTRETNRYLSVIDRCLKPGAYFYSYNYIGSPPPKGVDEDGSGHGLNKILKDMDVYDQYAIKYYNNFKVLHKDMCKSIILEKSAN